MTTVMKPFTPTPLQRRSPVPPDLEIAQGARLKSIQLVATDTILHSMINDLSLSRSSRRRDEDLDQS
jgi:hypothetical protein